MRDASDTTKHSQIAGEIVVAFLEKNEIDASRLPALVRDILGALIQGEMACAPLNPRSAETAIASAPPPSEPAPLMAKTAMGPTPAVPIEESVQPDFLISLEDGRQFRSLTRHLKARHGLTPDQYRQRWGLPKDYPMVAPSYAEERSAIAKRTGLGGVVKVAPKTTSSHQGRAKVSAKR